MRDPVTQSKRRLNRRHLLSAGVFGALALAGAAAGLRARGYPAPSGRVLASMSPLEYYVVQQAARRIAAPDRPLDATILSADDADVVGFVDAWMLRAPPRARRDLGRFFVWVEHFAPLAVGATSRFTRLAPAVQDRVLASLESSPSGLLRAGFDGLRSLVFMGYYRDPRTWKSLGYDGPLVLRPRAGWQ